MIVTSPEFRQIGSDVILLTRDIFADAASNLADSAKEAAEKSRPSEKEKKQGVDFNKLEQKGKATAKGLASGKLQGEARENIWDEVEQLREYVDDKLPEGEEAREKFIQRLQQVCNISLFTQSLRRSAADVTGHQGGSGEARVQAIHLVHCWSVQEVRPQG